METTKYYFIFGFYLMYFIIFNIMNDQIEENEYTLYETSKMQTFWNA